MQRLVYSPKVQAYVNTQSGVIDISDFIVSGTVQRVVNEVSTAELVIRNPGKRFTDPGSPTFRPMDGITIFGQRHKGRPVQLFTGYLDQSPYMQLFPGTATLRASCTLKRLLYTYMDGGLPYTWDFLKKYGWLADKSTGTIDSPSGRQQTTPNQGGDFTDGNVGDLMFGVLKDIGQWDEEQILIESFPKDAGEIVAGLSEDISFNVTEAQKQFEKFLTDIIGEYNPGTISGGIPGGSSGDGGPPSGAKVTPEEVARAMIEAGFPKDATVIASGIETMEGESGFGAAVGWDEPHDGGVLGYWQIRLSVHPDVTADCAMNLQCSTKEAYEIWKGAGGCFACLSGPNPWQGGTDNGTKYLNVAKKVLKEY